MNRRAESEIVAKEQAACEIANRLRSLAEGPLSDPATWVDVTRRVGCIVEGAAAPRGMFSNYVPLRRAQECGLVYGNLGPVGVSG